MQNYPTASDLPRPNEHNSSGFKFARGLIESILSDYGRTAEEIIKLRGGTNAVPQDAKGATSAVQEEPYPKLNIPDLETYIAERIRDECGQFYLGVSPWHTTELPGLVAQLYASFMNLEGIEEKENSSVMENFRRQTSDVTKVEMTCWAIVLKAYKHARSCDSVHDTFAERWNAILHQYKILKVACCSALKRSSIDFMAEFPQEASNKMRFQVAKNALKRQDAEKCITLTRKLIGGPQELETLQSQKRKRSSLSLSGSDDILSHIAPAATSFTDQEREIFIPRADMLATQSDFDMSPVATKYRSASRAANAIADSVRLLVEMGPWPGNHISSNESGEIPPTTPLCSGDTVPAVSPFRPSSDEESAATPLTAPASPKSSGKRVRFDDNVTAYPATALPAYFLAACNLAGIELGTGYTDPITSASSGIPSRIPIESGQRQVNEATLANERLARDALDILESASVEHSASPDLLALDSPTLPVHSLETLAQAETPILEPGIMAQATQFNTPPASDPSVLPDSIEKKASHASKTNQFED